MKISKKLIALSIGSALLLSILLFGLYLSGDLGIGETDVAKANGDCKRFMELEQHFEDHDELYDAFQAGEVDCNIREATFLNEFLKVYRTDKYECSLVETQLRYPEPTDFLAVMDAGTDKCVGDPTGEYVASMIRNAPP